MPNTFSSSPFPYDTPYADDVPDRATGKKTRSPYLSQTLVDWFLEQQLRGDAAPKSFPAVDLTGQFASIAATPLLTAPSKGLYRVSFYARVTQAGSVSSGLIVTVSWTDNGLHPTAASANATGNTTTTVLTGPSVTLRADQGTAINYATTYADGGGAQHMVYDLLVTIEALPT